MATAQQPSADELAKKLSNPVASLISVPFQYNFDYGYGSEDGSKNTLNIQPVIPTSISDDWNLITRVILPVVYQDDVFGDSGSQFGLGDTTPDAVLLAQGADPGRPDLGRGPGVPAADRDRRAAGRREVGHRPQRGDAQADDLPA